MYCVGVLECKCFILKKEKKRDRNPLSQEKKIAAKRNEEITEEKKRKKGKRTIQNFSTTRTL